MRTRNLQFENDSDTEPYYINVEFVSISILSINLHHIPPPTKSRSITAMLVGFGVYF